MTKEDITFQDKLNELRLDISHPNNKGLAFILLEGDSDIRLFRKLFNLEKCKVETVPGGKGKLEDCIERLVKIYPLIIGIRDADFMHLDNTIYSKNNVFLTDLHDIEMVIISQDEVFSALIFEYTSLSEDKHSETRNKIINSIEQISLLKWLNEKENLEYKFEAGFQDLISFANLNIDFPQYFSRILGKSPKARITDISIILNKMNALKQSNPDSLQLCNGHDFMKGLSRFIKEKGDGRTIGNEAISSSFRMTFTLSMFKKTKLFNNINTWAQRNNCILCN